MLAVSPKILVWARETAGLTLQDAARESRQHRCSGRGSRRPVSLPGPMLDQIQLDRDRDPIEEQQRCRRFARRIDGFWSTNNQGGHRMTSASSLQTLAKCSVPLRLGGGARSTGSTPTCSSTRTATTVPLVAFVQIASLRQETDPAILRSRCHVMFGPLARPSGRRRSTPRPRPTMRRQRLRRAAPRASGRPLSRPLRYKVANVHPGRTRDHACAAAR